MSRALGVPLTARGGGTSVAGNAVGTGIVLDFSRHVNRILVDRPRGADRAHRAGRRDGRPAEGRGAARAAVRAGPVDAGPRDARRDDRQQRVRSARRRLRPDRRQRARARHGRRDGPALHRVVRCRCARRGPGSRRARPLPPRRHPDRAGPVRPAGLRLLARAPAAREGHRPRQGARRHRGDGRHAARRDRPAGPDRRRPRARRPRLPRHADGRRRGARAARARTARDRGHGLAAGRRGPTRPRRRCRPDPAAGRGLADGRGRRRGPRRGARARPRARRRRRHDRRRAVPARSRRRPHVAHPRGRRRPRRPDAVGRAGLAGVRGLGGAAGAARRLPARARGAHGVAPRGRPGVRALRRRLRAPAPRHPARAVGQPAARVHGGRRRAGGLARRLAVRRARRRPRALRAALGHVHARRRSTCSARSRTCSTRATCSTPASSSAPARSTPTCAARGPGRCSPTATASRSRTTPAT